MSKAPLRTCIGCKKVRPKQELLRLVKTPQGQVAIDKAGKLSGRGAYLCLEEDCIKQALKGDKIAKALRVKAGDFNKQEQAESIYKKAGLKWPRKKQ